MAQTLPIPAPAPSTSGPHLLPATTHSYLIRATESLREPLLAREAAGDEARAARLRARFFCAGQQC